MTDALLAFASVTVVRGGRTVLHDVDLDVAAAGITVVIGPSGAGKSSLLRLGNRLDVPASGVVRFRGADVAGLDPLRLRRRVGMVFQRPTPFAGTVRDNIHAAEAGLDAAAVDAALRRVGLDPALADRPAVDLSGGEQQRVCLARALATQPEALLLDEPTSSVDPAARLGLEQLARDLAAAGVPLVWVTHDLGQMRRLADHVVVLVDGTVRFCGDPAALAACRDPATVAFVAGTTHETDADDGREAR